MLVVVVVIFIIGALGGGEEKATKVASNNSSNTKTSETTKEETFNVGDTADLKGYQITVNSVEFSNGNEYQQPAEGKQYVIINITIKNNTGDKAAFNPLDYSINEDGVSSTAGFGYLDGVETLNSGDLDNGATITGNLIGEANPNAKLKLRYEGNYFLKDKQIDFNLK
ncbi:DUF4352 domain-containing protein [Enterococcus sulfureus]